MERGSWYLGLQSIKIWIFNPHTTLCVYKGSAFSTLYYSFTQQVYHMTSIYFWSVYFKIDYNVHRLIVYLLISKLLYFNLWESTFVYLFLIAQPMCYLCQCSCTWYFQLSYIFCILRSILLSTQLFLSVLMLSSFSSPLCWHMNFDKNIFVCSKFAQIS